MERITIGIVTFKERLHLIKDLINSIEAKISNNIDIILVINCNNEELFDKEYRKNILTLCLEYDNIYPIICPEFKSLSKLWNTIVIFSKTDYILMLGDDVIINNENFIKTIYEYINNTGCEFFTLNNGFSHFIITKKILHKLNYFDERYLGVGNEDGDMVHRYIEMFGQRMNNINIDGVYNQAAYSLKNKNIETYVDNKPTFGREFANIKYVADPNGILGMSPFPIKRILQDNKQYPYEMFVLNNKHNLSEYKNIILDE